jgi:hypothetical protein
MSLRTLSYLVQVVSAVTVIWRFLRGWSHYGQVGQFAIALLLAFSTGAFGGPTGWDLLEPSNYVVAGVVTTLYWMASGRPEAWQRPSLWSPRSPMEWERALMRMALPLSIAVVVIGILATLLWSWFYGVGAIARVAVILLFGVALSLYLLAIRAWRRLPPDDRG